MFKKLKEKLKNWAKGFIKKEGISEESEPIKIKEKKETKIKPEKKEEEIKPIESHEYKKAEKRKEIPEEREIGKKISEDIEKEAETKESASEKPGFFKRIFSKITKVEISEKNFEPHEEELQLLLLENNVALEVAEKIIKRLKEEIVGKTLLKKEIEYEIKDAFKKIIKEILIEPFDLAEKISSRSDKSKPYVLLFCGVNGTGKTTTIAKIASMLKKKEMSCIIAAGDTFRAASIEQLKKHGEKLGIEVISNKYGADPASVGFDAIKHAEKKHVDCVLIDTAGRMHTAKNLMAQIEKISKVCKPDLKIFVGESITGNDSIEQVKSFDWAIGIDGIILTKADIDEKGGTALSVGYITKKPILYLGTGQEYDEIERFDKKKFIEKLGLGEEE